MQRRHADQRFRDDTNLIRLAEHLARASRDANAVASAQELEADYMRFNSVAMDMVQAQEAARKLSDGFLEEVPQLPWHELRGLRNAIVHEYDEIDPDALYVSATVDVPRLLAQLQPYLDVIED
ncbi:DUF86 domain-containing protein [Bifidobacterium thermophilum]|uniref:HepT-like ribonuclease domain-containing protein n=1 Tax=Bifidobacterium thermophilum TaxID=33905 RepID=UPI00399547C7